MGFLNPRNAEDARRIAPDGPRQLLLEDFQLSNGLVFSPDEAILYIDDSARKHIRAFDVRADGSLIQTKTRGVIPG